MATDGYQRYFVFSVAKPKVGVGCKGCNVLGACGFEFTFKILVAVFL
jgi:hypothetical protein